MPTRILGVCVEIHEQREHPFGSGRNLDVLKFPEPNLVEQHIAVEQLREPLDAGEKVLPSRQVVVLVLGGERLPHSRKRQGVRFLGLDFRSCLMRCSKPARRFRVEARQPAPRGPM